MADTYEMIKEQILREQELEAREKAIIEKEKAFEQISNTDSGQDAEDKQLEALRNAMGLA